MICLIYSPLYSLLIQQRYDYDSRSAIAALGAAATAAAADVGPPSPAKTEEIGLRRQVAINERDIRRSEQQVADLEAKLTEVVNECE